MSPGSKSDSELPVVPESLANSIGYLLNFNGHIIRERLEHVLEPLKLSLRELGVLRILESEGPLSQHVLGRRHNIDRTTTVQVIDQLEARQLVLRSQNVEDRRSNLLFLTPRGRKTLSRALKLVSKEQNAFLSPLSEDERKSLFRILVQLLSHHLAARQQPAAESTSPERKSAGQPET
jgi:MarR family transcriptional regulator, lower aerobic nicotinate degradation pathway regulator